MVVVWQVGKAILYYGGVEFGETGEVYAGTNCGSVFAGYAGGEARAQNRGCKLVGDGVDGSEKAASNVVRSLGGKVDAAGDAGVDVVFNRCLGGLGGRSGRGGGSRDWRRSGVKILTQ